MSLKDLSGEDQMVAVNKFMKYKELVYEIVQEHERKGQEIEFDQTLELLDKKLEELGIVFEKPKPFEVFVALVEHPGCGFCKLCDHSCDYRGPGLIPIVSVYGIKSSICSNCLKEYNPEDYLYLLENREASVKEYYENNKHVFVKPLQPIIEEESEVTDDDFSFRAVKR